MLIAPWALGFAFFTAIPMAVSLVLAFLEWDLITPWKFNGLDNWRRLVEDDLVTTSLGNTAYYTLIAVPLHVVAALGLAILLNNRMKGIGIFRTTFYLPSVTPQVASAIVFLGIFVEYGFANQLLQTFSLPPVGWLSTEEWAKPAFIIMSMWTVGPAMVISLAALQSVPETLLEAASIDGAGRWGRFWHVTIPMISPALFFNTVLGLIGSFQIFTQAYIITNGGPVRSTYFYVLHLYNNGFLYFRMGYASTLAWVLFVIIVAFTILQFRLSTRWVYSEA